MPTLTSLEEPDSYNMDYYYSKYRDRYGIRMNENNPSSLKVLPPSFNPESCDIQGTKKQHYFQVPEQPTIGTCYCKKYHTSFTSQFYRINHPTKIGQPSTQTTTSISAKKFKKISDELPSSPNTKTYKQLELHTANPKLLFPGFQTDKTPTAIIAHSQHYHTCYICKIKNIPCVATEQSSHAPDYAVACLFRNFCILHRTCAPQILDIKLKPLNPKTPLTLEQKSLIVILKLQQMSSVDKKAIYHFFLQKIKDSNQAKEETQKPKQSRDTSNDLDWFKEYPVTPEMEQNMKFSNTLAYQILDFIKPHLIDVYPGKITRPATKNTPESKFNYKYLIKAMAGKRPKFLTDLIHEANPSIDKSITIPFEFIHSTFVDLLKEFTTSLFTQLNYPKILSSYNSIPPYSIRNRNQVALNLARLHLILHDKYQTINAYQFCQDLNIRPIYLRLHYYISEDSINQPLFKIQNDTKFNINIALNIPKKQFLQSFKIPSLKPYLTNFYTWFEKFFETYKRQFTKIDQKKTYNYIKHQIALKLSDTCKALLPSEFKITSIDSLRERIQLCFQAALYHIHTCNSENCSTLPSDVEHNVQNLYTSFFTESFGHFPAPQNLPPKPKYHHPTLNFSIFDREAQHAATFQKRTPIFLFRQLATETEQQFLELNNLNKEETNQARLSFYFYNFFNAYNKAAAINDQIDNLSLHSTIEKITAKPIDTDFLARVMTYFHILKEDKPSIASIQDAYNKKFYPEAQKILFDKFKVQFKKPSIKSIFYNPTSSTKINSKSKPSVQTNNNTTNDPTNLQTNLLPTQQPSNSSGELDDDVIMSDTNNIENVSNSNANIQQESHITTSSYNPFQ
jgi:hypothetical protein